jgi:ABC-type multidrug transport system ATPase subunit
LITAKITYSHFLKHLPSIPAPQITDEVIAIDEETHDVTKDFAIHIRNVLRVFSDETNKPIIAVNNVSLEIKHGVFFSFLSANGADKTTLMEMIASEISPSNGFLNVDGNAVICPQFSNYLTNEMSFEEHFRFSSFIFGLRPIDAECKQERFIRKLVLQQHLRKQIQILSDGNPCKLAIAIVLLLFVSFMPLPFMFVTFASLRKTCDQHCIVDQ